ncbi:MFS general substrate transporter [Testicularia cyperi]|uniref:MFS general substrate transporter n=1 Tax=Testicularia cyperi TaxID=1882483 RepID=A0A317XVV7_9BASI|nr:MFS general substrate transporter [Testicularia cyperi]
MQSSKTPSFEDEKVSQHDDAAKAQAYVGHVTSKAYVGDENAKAQALSADAASVTDEELKRVLRKIDIVLMPLMSVAVLLQFLDKTSLNYANLLGIKSDTNLRGQEYSWLGSFFYVGYLAATPIHGFFLQKANLSLYAGLNIILWGIVLGAHAACNNYSQLVAVRFFLGFFEASLTPAFILLTGRFYRPQEQVTRTSIWFANNGWAQILGGGICYGLLVQKPGKLETWREMFLILGGIAIAFGLVCIAFMPSSPATIRFLNERERQVAVYRIRANKAGIHDTKWKWSQMWEAIKDVRLYLFFLGVCTANIANGGVSNFGSQIIKQFGYDSKTTALLGMAPGLMEVVAIYFGAYLSYATRSRVIPGTLMYLIAVAGGAMMIGIPAQHKAWRMFAYTIVFAYPCASPYFYSFLGSSVSGTTKRIVFNVLMQLGYSTGNMIGPQTYQSKDAPDYVPAKITLIAMFAAAAACLAAISGMHYVWNRKNAAMLDSPDIGDDAEDLTDLTDKERKNFRYPY